MAIAMTAEQKTALSKVRAAYNAALPDIIDPETKQAQPKEQHPDYIASDDDYFNARVTGMLDSYVKQTTTCPTCGKVI